jgi:hypothetical protein
MQVPSIRRLARLANLGLPALHNNSTSRCQITTRQMDRVWIFGSNTVHLAFESPDVSEQANTSYFLKNCDCSCCMSFLGQKHF